MTDLISRQAAIKALCKRCDLVQDDNAPCMEKCNDIKILEKLPSASQPITRIDAGGTLWVTVDDCEKANKVIVCEHDSRYCGTFYPYSWDFIDEEPYDVEEIIREQCRALIDIVRATREGMRNENR